MSHPAIQGLGFRPILQLRSIQSRGMDSMLKGRVVFS